ncbi:hypothetical protein AX15_005344 [Amanita polypyramis BW_CC]|nr:hypothetical protein AX15_005344 [Amanita polypyramis BW_CC]
MVTAAAPSTQSHDPRKKYSVEKAKVAHLTRQLQLRLQYAKLKVDHGWHRQNLNEVENLYFRHSHVRGLKPHVTPLILDPNHELGSINALPSHSSIKPTNVPRDPKHETTEVHRPSPPVRNSRPEASTTTSLSAPTHLRDSSLMQIDVSSSPSAEETFTTNAVVPSAQQNSHFDASIQGGWTGKTAPRPLSQAPAPPMGINHSTSFNLQQSIGSLTTNPPNMALTYDSFWSNHNTTRPFRSSFFSMLDSSNIETNKVAAQSLPSGISGRSINGYLSNGPGLVSDLMTASSSPPSDITPTTSPTAQRAIPTIAEGLKDR